MGHSNVAKRKQRVTIIAGSQGNKGFCTAARLAVLKALLPISAVHLHGHHDITKRDLQQIKANYRSSGTVVNDTRAHVLIQGKSFDRSKHILWINI